MVGNLIKATTRILVLSLIAYFLSTDIANCQEENDIKNTIDWPPLGLLMFSVAPKYSDEKSSIVGGELQINIKKQYFPLTLGLHGQIQKQSFDAKDYTRWGLGASLNYYIPLNPSTISYLGLKSIKYFGMGKTQDAISCFYCSNIEETYSGREEYISVGIIYKRVALQMDKRISSKKSSWSESAYDPYGVGSNYYSRTNEIPGPDLTISLGLRF